MGGSQLEEEEIVSEQCLNVLIGPPVALLHCYIHTSNPSEAQTDLANKWWRTWGAWRKCPRAAIVVSAKTQDRSRVMLWVSTEPDPWGASQHLLNPPCEEFRLSAVKIIRWLLIVLLRGKQNGLLFFLLFGLLWVSIASRAACCIDSNLIKELLQLNRKLFVPLPGNNI